MTADADRGSSPVLFCIGLTLALVALYFLFAGAWGITESVACVVAVLASLGTRALAQRNPSRPLRITGIPAHSVLSVARSMVRDSWVVGKILLGALWRGPRKSIGAWTEQPLVQGKARETDAFGRGFMTLAISVAPNQFVVQIPQGKEILLVHCLGNVEPKPRGRWPV